MSAYILDDEIYHAIYSKLDLDSNSNALDGYYTRALTDLPGAPDRELIKDFIIKLHRQNYDSVHFRYAHNESVPKDDYTPIEPRLTSKTITNIQLLKLLECVAYQSCETTDYYKSSVGKLTAELIKRLCSEIVSSLPEYKSAKWGEL